MTAPHDRPSAGETAAIAAHLRAHIPVLSTDRLILRAPRMDDFETYAEIACAPRGSILGDTVSREDAWADFMQITSSWLLHGHRAWAIGSHEEGRTLGFVLLCLDEDGGAPELGLLLTPEAEGRGIAEEAARAVLSHTWDRLGFGTLVSYLAPFHHRPMNLAQRLGALRDGDLADSLVYRYKPAGNAGGRAA